MSLFDLCQRIDMIVHTDSTLLFMQNMVYVVKTVITTSSVALSKLLKLVFPPSDLKASRFIFTGKHGRSQPTDVCVASLSASQAQRRQISLPTAPLYFLYDIVWPLKGTIFGIQSVDIEANNVLL